MKLLGKGGYGKVYEISDGVNKFAMKVIGK